MSGGYSAARARQDEYLASLVIRDARARADGVDKDGVLAYLHRPKTRERPNETFLANTLRGARSANERDARRANDTERCVSERSRRPTPRRPRRRLRGGVPFILLNHHLLLPPPPPIAGRRRRARRVLSPPRARDAGEARPEAARTSPALTSSPFVVDPSSEPTGYAYVAEDPVETVPADAPQGAKRHCGLGAAKRAKRDARKERKEKKRKEERKERKRANGRDARESELSRRLAVGCGRSLSRRVVRVVVSLVLTTSSP